jgi:G:T/U-mismatch repair DNA glycosylase/8-oxo-dGTP pyrophosphatase MutT (NUDIX family)
VAGSADETHGSGERSAVPDVLAPGLRCVFCGINPGRVSDAAAAHFANPRNDFWRLLHDAGFTPRLLDPQEQFELLPLGWGVTNAAYRTTPGSGDLRRGDFDLGRLERMALELAPHAVAYVGKEAYRGVWGERPELGVQQRVIGAGVGQFVLPSTSPANAAVPYEERLRWFRALHAWLDDVRERPTARAFVVDDAGRVLLVRFRNRHGDVWWAAPGGGIEPGETADAAIRRELREEVGLAVDDPGEVVWARDTTFSWDGRLVHMHERFFLVRVGAHEPRPAVDLAAENVVEVAWWTPEELATPRERLAPLGLAEVVRTLTA